MYTEENKKRYDVRSIILKIIIAAIIVLLVVIMIPNLFSNDNKVTEDTPSYASVYADNVEKIKDATLEYYGLDKIPTKENEMVNVTLEQLIKDNLLTEIKDSENNSCNITNSYTNLTYEGNNKYSLVVRLECPKQNQAIEYFVYLNEECEDTLCNKVPETTEDDTEHQEEEIKPSTEPSTTTTPSTVTQYEYYKVTPAGVGNWSAWSEWKTVDTTINPISCNDNDLNCTYQRETKVELTTVGTLNIPYYQTYQYLRLEGNYTGNYCTGATYQKVDGTVYSYTGGTFVSEGIITTTVAPTDTYNTRYEFVGIDDSKCGANCYESQIQYKYEKFVYSGTITKYNGNSSCTKAIVTVPQYVTDNKTVSGTRLENVSSYVRYAREQTRVVTTESKTEYTWSSYDNKTLINNGWKYTGKTK